jgi:hypothetical protein
LGFHLQEDTVLGVISGTIEFRQYKISGVKKYFVVCMWNEKPRALIAGRAASRFTYVFTIVIYIPDRTWLVGTYKIPPKNSVRLLL